MPTFSPALVANERPLLYLDSTLFVNIGLWLVLFLVLRYLLWDPMIRLLTAREQGLGGSRDDAEELRATAASLKKQWEDKLREGRATALASREKHKQSAGREEASVLAAAREEVQAVVLTQRSALAAQRETLTAELKGVMPSLAAQVASKVLGREVQS